MSSQNKVPLDSKEQEQLERIEQHNHRVEHFFRHILHLLERIIAVITIIALVIALGIEIYHMCHDISYFSDIDNFLHHVLTIVVGLEFVRMLIDTTPANVLEVLTVAITRYVVLSHEDYWSNLVCIVCIAILFAIRRFLVRRSELKEEMVETE